MSVVVFFLRYSVVYMSFSYYFKYFGGGGVKGLSLGKKSQLACFIHSGIKQPRLVYFLGRVTIPHLSRLYPLMFFIKKNLSFHQNSITNMKVLRKQQMLKSVVVLATVISCYINTTNNIFLAMLQQACTVLMDLCILAGWLTY